MNLNPYLLSDIIIKGLNYMKSNKLKHAIKILIFIVFTVSSSIFSLANLGIVFDADFNEDGKMLSLMEDNELFELLNESNVYIPEINDSFCETMTYIKSIIKNMEENLDYYVVANYNEYNTFFNNIYGFVKDYYSKYNILFSNKLTLTRDENELIDSLVWDNGEWSSTGGDWNPKWMNYNCYSYSIRRNEYPNFYGTSFQYQPGDFSGTGSYQFGMSVDDLSDIIEDDLSSLGYTVVYNGTVRPEVVGENQELICVRTGVNIYYNNFTDYHFMRYDKETDSWYHKPGGTAVLKYKYEHPSNSNYWTNENSVAGFINSYDIIYNSTIYYLLYNVATIDLKCNTSQHTINDYINIKMDRLYKINIDCAKSYKFISNSSNPIEMNFYNSDMDLIPSVAPIMSIDNCTGTITTYLNPGTYYLRINFLNNSDSGNIVTTYQATWPSDGTQLVLGSTTNLSTNLHKTSNNTYHSLAYINNTQGVGYYNFTLNIGTNAIYTEGMISIYSDSSRLHLLDRYSIDEIPCDAVSQDTENSLCVYLPNEGYFYVEIVLPDNNYSSLTLKVERTDVNNIDYLPTLSSTSLNVLFENKMLVSYFEEVTISHKSKIELDILTSGNINSNTPVYIFQRLIEPGLDMNIIVSYPVLVSDLDWEITSTNRSPVFSINLNAGTYYVGYSDNFERINISFALRRVVNQNVDIDNTLVADPALNQGFTLGSEVTVNNGLCNNYNITEGFTRCIYLMVDNRFLQPISRLDYDWYSSDETVATVSKWGTVLALSVDTDTNVTIYAVLKEDPSVVYRKAFIVKNDTLTYNDSPLDYNLYMSVGVNDYVQIDLSSLSVPIDILQYYAWSVQGNIYINPWGYIITHEANLGTYSYVTGEYELNSRIKIHLIIFVTSPMLEFGLDYDENMWCDVVGFANNCYNYPLKPNCTRNKYFMV